MLVISMTLRMLECDFGRLANAKNGGENGVGNDMVCNTVFHRFCGREICCFWMVLGMVLGMFWKCFESLVKEWFLRGSVIGKTRTT